MASFGLIGLVLIAIRTAQAHVSEQGLVLLLPTNVYITTGVLAVVLTIVLLAYLPIHWTRKLFETKLRLSRAMVQPKTPSALNSTPLLQVLANTPSLFSTLILIALLWIGFTGARDPLENPLPLFIWTLWWIGFAVLQGVFGDLWRHLNPWTGVYRTTKQLIATQPIMRLPKKVGAWPGVIGLLLFMIFALADTAPDAPTRLAIIVGIYWLGNLLALYVFGEQWLNQGECFTMLFNRYAQLAPIARIGNIAQFGFPGWHACANRAMTLSGAVFILVLLGSGSFDGLNETFRWLAFIGVNPLEFPGRSAIIGKTIAGLVATNILLILVYGACVYIGTRWANSQPDHGQSVSYHKAFCQLSIAILPIAFAYHFAHFLTAFMVNVQYALAAASDPLDSGADLLNLGTFYVTTGFMNSHHTVEAIWLTQAAAVVIGHVLSIMLAHAIALDLFASARRAIISQVPLAALMVVYTFIGLWLLAAPRGA